MWLTDCPGATVKLCGREDEGVPKTGLACLTSPFVCEVLAVTFDRL